ncbi:MAG: preprotein translocase subunit SecY [Candidatus Omnitrophica bacterium]|nr:preprotein translocase subunit SecY [Candidatus Omnitrophota bacterium]
MLETFANIFKVEELKTKLFITLALLIVERIGCFIPTPGIDTQALSKYFEDLVRSHGQTFFGLINIFTGGALHRLSIFALGIMPYISASIIMQLLTVVIPSLSKISQEGRAGYERINQYTRYLTLGLCLFQGFMLAKWLENPQSFGGVIVVPHPGLLFELVTVFTLTCGTIFVMWLGEQIQERGIGNGISLIITVGIISRIPTAMYQLWVLFSPFNPSQRQISALKLITLMIVGLLVIMAVVCFTQAQRKLPIQYARRVVGRKMYGGQSTFLPIKVDMAGVIAIIFAQSVLLFPSTIANFLPKTSNFLGFIQKIFKIDGFWYNLGNIGLIIFFMFFYTAIVFNPIEISNNLKKYGGFIPGIRPGKNTAEYIDFVATRIVFVGALYVAVVATLPSLFMKIFDVPSYQIVSFFGGTTILIIVGVVLDTMRQIEGQLLLRHYEGFIKGKTLRGRR